MFVCAAAAVVEKKSLLEQQEAEQARSVGLHLRGKAIMREGLVDEDDPARFFWHRQGSARSPLCTLQQQPRSCTVTLLADS